MRVPTVYLETTVFNFYFADDSPEKRRDTLKLFEEIKEGRYEPYTSNSVLLELEKDAEPKRTQMLKLLESYGIIVLPAQVEERQLADIYIAEGIIP